MGKTLPTISVIICAYNGESYLERSIDSVLNQTVPFYELILVNDGSRDGTLSIMRAVQKRYSGFNIKVIDLPQNHGIGVARNLGIQKATGDYLAFLDADDRLSPVFLEEMDAVLQQERWDAISFGQMLIDESGKSLSKGILPFVGNSAQVTQKRWQLHAVLTLCICADILQKNDLVFPDCPLYEDVIFCMELAPFLHNIYVIEKPLYQYCINSQSVSQNGLCAKMAASPKSNMALFSTAQKVMGSLTSTQDIYMLQYKINSIYYDYLLYSLTKCAYPFIKKEYARWHQQMKKYFPCYKKVSMWPSRAKLLPPKQAWAWWCASWVDRMGLLKVVVLLLQTYRKEINDNGGE